MEFRIPRVWDRGEGGRLSEATVGGAQVNGICSGGSRPEGPLPHSGLAVHRCPHPPLASLAHRWRREISARIRQRPPPRQPISAAWKAGNVGGALGRRPLGAPK